MQHAIIARRRLFVTVDAICCALLRVAGQRFALGVMAVLVSALSPAADLAPFSEKPHAQPPVLKARTPVGLPIALDATAWSVLNPPPGAACWRIAASESGPVLSLDVARCDEGSTRLWTALPRALCTDAWDTQECDGIACEARAIGGSSTLALYAIAGRATANDAGSLCPFVVSDAGWQPVVIPVAWLGVKRAAAIRGIGVQRVAGPEGAAMATTVELRNLRLVRSSYEAGDVLRPAAKITLAGTWRFAPESDAAQQAAADCDDRAWATVETGKTLQDQGIACAGWAWYRQAVIMPAALVPAIQTDQATVTIELPRFAFDDEVYINGVRIGATHGLYRFAEFDQRRYAIPATALRFDQPNRIAIRLWGSDALRQGRAESGLLAGIYTLNITPAALLARTTPDQPAVPAESFDLSAAQHSLPFELLARLPAGMALDPHADVRCTVLDGSGRVVLATAAQRQDSAAGACTLVVAVPEAAARELYLRGRFTARFTVVDPAGAVLAALAFPVDRPCYAERDRRVLPALSASAQEPTPYGALRLVDEIDAADALEHDPHPYMQNPFSAGKAATPGGHIAVAVHEILGRKARVADEPGWFAYRLGRGGLRAGQTYLLRIEYPEDVPRYAAVQVQTGRDQVGVGWRNGVSPGDPYDNYPLSGRWQWFDTIIVAGATTSGSQGAYSAAGEAGFWLYFLNKVNPGKYFPMYAGGPAIGRIRLYEIDATQHAPHITAPEGLPARSLLFDWEREPDQDIDGVCHYARLMGYSAVAPTILKWGTSLWAPPLAGYEAANVDHRGYSLGRRAGEAPGAPAAVSDLPTAHEQYLRLTAENHLRYLPRIEYGGSSLLPEAAWAIDPQGGFAKPNRFAQWSANLLREETYDDFKRVLDHLLKPYPDAPLAGILWRIRSERMQISYGSEDLARFFTDTGRAPPALHRKELARLVASGELAEAYRAWWFAKRAQFHVRIRDLLRSYRPDLELYYYNWDIDKWGLGIYDQTTAKYFTDAGLAGDGNALQTYQRNLALIAGFTGDDFVRLVRTGTVNAYLSGHADQALEMEPYRTLDGIHVFCPSNYVYSSNSPQYLEYFRTGSGVAVSNTISYDENGYKRLHPGFECNMVIGGGGDFSMANELLAWFHADARVLTYTAYTFARGFADAHRRFAQAFLALPAVPGTVLPSSDADVCIRSYADGRYVGVANRAAVAKTITVHLPGQRSALPVVTDLVADATVPCRMEGDGIAFDLTIGAMQLAAVRIR